MNDVERYVKEAGFFASITSMGVVDKSIKEKIDDITDFINDSRNPSHNLFFARGSLYDDTKEYRKAEADYNEAKKLGMPLSKYHNAMGVLYSNLFSSVSADKQSRKKEKYFNVSKKHYEDAIELYKKDGNNRRVSSCCCNLACLYQDNGQYEDAIKYFEEAINTDKSNAIAYFDRAISYQERGEEYYENAFSDYTNCLIIDPNLTDACLYRAELAIEMYELSRNVRYKEIAQSDSKKLSERTSRLSRLQERIRRNKSDETSIEGLVAKIDEKIADLSVEEAKEYKKGTDEYTKCINEAKEYYSEAMEYYRNSYQETMNDMYKEAIDRIVYKLSQIDE